MVEDYPRFFNPFRYFPVDIMFRPGENLWNGGYDEKSRKLVTDMYKELDMIRVENMHVKPTRESILLWK